jgi:hypothetical protein
VSNIDAITNKLPSDMVRKWMDYSNELLDSQLGAAFKRFIAQEWKYATSVVSRTTSAESALKAMGSPGAAAAAPGARQRRPEAPETTTKMANVDTLAISARTKCRSDPHSRVGEATWRARPHTQRPEARLEKGVMTPARMTTRKRVRFQFRTRKP